LNNIILARAIGVGVIPFFGAKNMSEHKVVNFDPNPKDCLTTDQAISKLTNLKYHLDSKNNNQDIIVSKGSPVWQHRLVNKLCCALHVESFFGFVQWGRDAELPEDNPSNPSDATAHIFVENGKIVGVAGFLAFKTETKMHFLYTIPAFRGKGYARQRWNTWKQRYGDFGLTQPYTKDGIKYLKSVGILPGDYKLTLEDEIHDCFKILEQKKWITVRYVMTAFGVWGIARQVYINDRNLAVAQAKLPLRLYQAFSHLYNTYQNNFFTC
jgi:GNAT superfamily N-acetyltransferase